MSRFDYVRYDEKAQEQSAVFKNEFEALTEMIETLPPTAGRARALAITSMEEAFMWVGKAIRDDQIARNGSAALMEERKNG